MEYNSLVIIYVFFHIFFYVMENFILHVSVVLFQFGASTTKKEYPTLTLHPPWALVLTAQQLCLRFHPNDHHAESFGTEMTLQAH